VSGGVGVGVGEGVACAVAVGGVGDWFAFCAKRIEGRKEKAESSRQKAAREKPLIKIFLGVFA
jgi:hypothetical protein